MKYAIAAPEQRTLAIANRSERFPVNRIYCIGRNYAAHAREMDSDPDREPPFFFMKAGHAALDAAGAEIAIPYPSKTKSFHHEVELTVAIAHGGAAISVERALEHVYGYAVGLDMTRRDLQLDARNKGRPWEIGKSFAYSAPIAALHPAQEVGHPDSAAISLTVNGQARQSSDISKLIWSVAECIAYLSQYDPLEPGDLIMTGTPEGVDAVLPGDVMVGAIAGLGELRVRVDTR